MPLDAMPTCPDYSPAVPPPIPNREPTVHDALQAPNANGGRADGGGAAPAIPSWFNDANASGGVADGFDLLSTRSLGRRGGGGHESEVEECVIA